MLDLERFGRALRLRWLWFAWTDPDRPWVGSEVPCNALDRQLFRCSTSVTIGDGKRALFWDSAWFHGHAPRDVAPNLYKLAWRKRLTVRDEVDNQTWTRGLWRMSNAAEIAEFIVLWEAVQDIHFSDTPDEIVWKWTANGKYTSASAYVIQFAGECALSTPLQFGRLRLKANIVSSPGFLFRSDSIPRMCCCSKVFSVTRSARYVISSRERLLTSACIAPMSGRFGGTYKSGQKD